MFSLKKLFTPGIVNIIPYQVNEGKCYKIILTLIMHLKTNLQVILIPSNVSELRINLFLLLSIPFDFWLLVSSQGRKATTCS